MYTTRVKSKLCVNLKMLSSLPQIRLYIFRMTTASGFYSIQEFFMQYVIWFSSKTEIYLSSWNHCFKIWLIVVRYGFMTLNVTVKEIVPPPCQGSKYSLSLPWHTYPYKLMFVSEWNNSGFHNFAHFHQKEVLPLVKHEIKTTYNSVKTLY